MSKPIVLQLHFYVECNITEELEFNVNYKIHIGLLKLEVDYKMGLIHITTRELLSPTVLKTLLPMH